MNDASSAAQTYESFDFPPVFAEIVYFTWKENHYHKSRTVMVDTEFEIEVELKRFLLHCDSCEECRNLDYVAVSRGEQLSDQARVILQHIVTKQH